MSESQGLPDIVPVFPLPGVVLFPRQVLPLHIFEPRYREMTADALEGDSWLSIALLKPGFEQSYFTRQAPIHRLICVGRIVSSERLADGKYNILVHGMSRARILCELTDRAYRRARIEWVPSVGYPGEEQACELRKKLRCAVDAAIENDIPICRDFQNLFQIDLCLSDVCDVLSAGLPVDEELRQCLLAEANVAERARLLIEQLQTLVRVARGHRPAAVGPWRMN